MLCTVCIGIQRFRGCFCKSSQVSKIVGRCFEGNVEGCPGCPCGIEKRHLHKTYYRPLLRDRLELTLQAWHPASKSLVVVNRGVAKLSVFYQVSVILLGMGQ